MDNSHAPPAKRPRLAQRACMFNDVVSLHERKLQEMQEAADDAPKKKQALLQQVQQWNDAKILYEAEPTPAALSRLRQWRRQLVDEERRLNDIESGKALADYLLDSVQYLNAQHAVTSDLLELRRQPRTDENARREEHLTLQQRANAHEYSQKFFPDLVRDVDDARDRQPHRNTCAECGADVTETDNSLLVCTQCGVVHSVGLSLTQTNNLNWADLRDAPARQHTYRRLNHFREYLRQIQGKSKTEIPQEVMDSLREEFRKARIPADDINPRRARKMLKKIKQVKFYEHVESIASQLNPNYYPPNIPPSREEKLCLMFVQLEKPFDKVKHVVKRDRKNFLSYPFVFFKLNELNGWHEYNEHCNLLKSVALINKQDSWWKLVMEELGWEVVGRTFDM